MKLTFVVNLQSFTVFATDNLYQKVNDRNHVKWLCILRQKLGRFLWCHFPLQTMRTANMEMFLIWLWDVLADNAILHCKEVLVVLAFLATNVLQQLPLNLVIFKAFCNPSKPGHSIAVCLPLFVLRNWQAFSSYITALDVE